MVSAISQIPSDMHGKEEMEFQKQLEHTRKYADAFWQHEMIDRPYISIIVPPKQSTYRYSQSACFEAGVSGEYDKFLIPYMEHLKKCHFAGEAVPSMNLNLGTDQYAGFFGARMENGWEEDTTWSVPCLKDYESFEPIIDRSEKSHYNKVKRFYEYACKMAGGRYLVEMADLHSNMDALSALRGAEELCMDIYDCPEEVHRVLNAVRKTYPEVYNMLYEAGNMKEMGTIGWSPIYCRGRSAVIQCDFAYILSPEHGREFVFPAIEEEAEFLDHSIYHMDGIGELTHLDTILAIDAIDCIQWVPGAGQPRTLEWMDLLKKIQAAGKSLWIYDWTPEEIKAFHKELQPDKVAYTLQMESRDEAEELIEFLVKNT